MMSLLTTLSINHYVFRSVHKDLLVLGVNSVQLLMLVHFMAFCIPGKNIQDQVGIVTANRVIGIPYILTFIVLGVTPCQLVCLSAENNFIIVIRQAVVADGTPCKNLDSSNAICVQGTCTVRHHSSYA